jgi:hypothetical protein
MARGEAKALALPSANTASAAHTDASMARTGRSETTTLLDTTASLNDCLVQMRSHMPSTGEIPYHEHG